MRLIIIILVLPYFYGFLFCQTPAPEDFFPFHVGDVWEYYTTFQSFPQKRILTKDSVTAEGHYLFYNDYRFNNDANLPRFLIDTSLYVIEEPSSILPWVNIKRYKLDADSGDTWITYTDSSHEYQGRAVVKDTYWSYVLGKYTLVKVIDYYAQPLGDTSLWGSYDETDHIAAGFGFIFRVREGAQWPNYIIGGALINGDTSGILTSLGKNNNYMPQTASLKQNYPNPFNPQTTIEFELFEKAEIELGVFNILGQKVAVLAKGAYPAGTYKFTFDAHFLSSGQYLYYLRAGTRTLVGKMNYVK